MIRAYTRSPENSAALEQAAKAKGYPIELQIDLDREALARDLDGILALVIDLTSPVFPPERVLATLDSLESAAMPPVLYIVSDSSVIAQISQSENVVNQDYTFAPVTAESLALRLEVLLLLGARRRVALESAITDRLTGLYNRKYFLRRLEEEMYRAIRYGYNVGCILTDVDFSTDSGKLSEDAGTTAVKQVAEFFTGRLRRTDVVARFRWSEFAVLLPDIPREDSLAVAIDLKKKIEALSVSDGKRAVRLSAAVGHLVFPAEGVATALEVVEALEDCCFASKQGTAGEIAVYAGGPASPKTG